MKSSSNIFFSERIYISNLNIPNLIYVIEIFSWKLLHSCTLLAENVH